MLDAADKFSSTQSRKFGHSLGRTASCQFGSARFESVGAGGGGEPEAL